MPLRRKTIKRQTDSGPSPHEEYSLVCYCAKVISGRRREESQIVKCPDCSETLYVLPRDIYPRPHILALETRDKTSEEKVSIEAPHSLSVKDLNDEGRLAEPEDNTPPRVWIDEGQGALNRKRLASVVGVTIVLLLVALWALSNRKSRSENELVLLEESEAVWEYVTLNEWGNAETSAMLALKAAEDLGRTDESSLALEHLYKELMILNRLSIYSPIEIILDQSQESIDSESWDVMFRARHGGRWLLMQGDLVRQSTLEEIRYSFEHPIDLPTEDVDMVWDEAVDWFADLAWEDDRVRVFLAVQLTISRTVDQQQNSWEIILSSEEVKLWRTPELLAEMFKLDLKSEANAELSSLLNSQRVSSSREEIVLNLSADDRANENVKDKAEPE